MKVILRTHYFWVDCKHFAGKYLFRPFTGNYVGFMTRPSVKKDILTSGE
jgi:hypothetical protein